MNPPRMPPAAGAATVVSGALLVLGALWLCGQATARGSQPDGLAVFLIVAVTVIGVCVIVTGVGRSSRPARDEADAKPYAGPPSGPTP